MELLTARDRTQLSQWIGKACDFKLEYKISRDGCSASTFHRVCDGIGPTVTILYNTDNTVYGGFLSKDWKNSEGWIKDNHAFLFTLHFNGVSRPRKFSVANANEAAYAHQRLGPAFGNVDMSLLNPYPTMMGRGKWAAKAHRESDLLTFYDTVNVMVERGTKTQYFSLNGQAGFGGAYQKPNENMNFINNGHMSVFDLEVYTVKGTKTSTSSSPEQLSSKTWRESPLWNAQGHQTLKEFVSNYKPLEDMNSPEVNILLVGQIGAGKSSIFNTISSVFRGELTARACAGNSLHSLTTTLRKYRIRNPEKGGYLNFRLCDTPGLEEDMSIKHQDMALLLDGFLSDQYKFNPIAHASQRDQGYNNTPTFRDKIHCVAFVIDGSSVDVLQGTIRQQLLQFRSLMVERGIPQIVYLTKLDKVCPLVDKDVRLVFHSDACRKALETTADVIGIPRGHIFPVKNYEKETQLNTGVDILALTAFRQTLLYADDFLEDQFEISCSL